MYDVNDGSVHLNNVITNTGITVTIIIIRAANNGTVHLNNVNTNAGITIRAINKIFTSTM